MALKNINDENLVEGDVIKYHCEKCNKNVVMKIMFTPEGMLGKCCSCREFMILKKNEDCVSEIPIQNIPSVLFVDHLLMYKRSHWVVEQ